MLNIKSIALGLSVLMLGANTAAAQQTPSVSLNSVLQYDVYEDGSMAIEITDLAFIPSSAPQMRVVVRKASGEKLATYRFYDDYRMQAAVFGRLTPDGGPVHQFAPGDYALDFTVRGKLVKSVPFAVEKASTSSDPFAPGSSYRFQGPWQKWAYLTENSAGAASVYFWSGLNDLPQGVKRAPYIAKVFRDGKLIAHTSRRTGLIASDWMKRYNNHFLTPHTQRKAHNAKIIPLSELKKSGSYRLDIELTDTGTVLRSFSYSATGGAFNPHPRTQLGYQPHADYVFPRAPDTGSSSYEWSNVHWMMTNELASGDK